MKTQILKRSKLIALFGAAALAATAVVVTVLHHNHSAHPPRPNYSKPERIVPACETSKCQVTALTTKHAVLLWRNIMSGMGETVPDYFNTDLALRRVGIESNMGGLTHASGSSYTGILQFSQTKKGGLFETEIDRILPVMNAAQNDIPVLKDDEIKQKNLNIAIAEKQLAEDRKHVTNLQTRITAAGHKRKASQHTEIRSRHAASGGEHRTSRGRVVISARAPHARAHREPPVNLAALHAELRAAQQKVTVSQKELLTVKARLHYPVTKETLERVFNDPTVQVFMDMTLALQADRNLSQNPNYQALTEREKNTVLYLMHNAPRFSTIVADEIGRARREKPKGFQLSEFLKDKAIGWGLMNPPESKERTVDQISRKYKAEGYQYIFRANSGIYQREGLTFPREVVDRYYALTDQFVRIYGMEGAPHLTHPQVPVKTSSNKPLRQEAGHHLRAS